MFVKDHAPRSYGAAPDTSNTSVDKWKWMVDGYFEAQAAEKVE